MKNEVDRRLFLKWANLVGIAAWFQPVAASGPNPLEDAKPVHPELYQARTTVTNKKFQVHGKP
jgi:hypothetical protein